MSASTPAILICGHGSRNPDAAPEFFRLVEKIRQRRPGQMITGAFLEFNQPTIEDALQDIYDQGERNIIAQPLTLYAADHSHRDIPDILNRFQQKHPDMTLRYGAALGLCPPVIDAAVHVVTPFLQEDCEILVVGRGSPDRRVADQTINLCQKLHQRLPAHHIRYCYAGHSLPMLVPALEQAARSHYRAAVILPFLLFPGRLLEEIYHAVDGVAAQYPAVHFHKAPPLGPQNSIADAALVRIDALS